MTELKDRYGPLVRIGDDWIDFSKISGLKYMKAFPEKEIFSQLLVYCDRDQIYLDGEDHISEFFQKLDEYHRNSETIDERLARRKNCSDHIPIGSSGFCPTCKTSNCLWG